MYSSPSAPRQSSLLFTSGSSTSIGGGISLNPRTSQQTGAMARAFYPLRKLRHRLSIAIERTQPFYGPRWAFTALLLVGFMLRILIVQGWYVVTYALWIYLLNAFLAFLSPKFDPSEGEIENDVDLSEQSGPALPTSSLSSATDEDDEFRPFVRRMPEFIFWYSATVAIILSIVASCFTIFDIPVFWPILVIYFVILFAVTMKRQIKHMIKYKYIPFDFRKKTYGGGSSKSSNIPFSSLTPSASTYPHTKPSSPAFSSSLTSTTIPHYVPPMPYASRDRQ